MPQDAPTQEAPAQAAVETLVIEMLANLKSKTSAEVRTALRQRGDSMPCDSLDSVEILLELEDRYAITLPDDQETADALRSVTALAQHVRRKISEKAGVG